MNWIKFIRIFLLVLIIIGIGLLLTQKLWVPKLVDMILASGGDSQSYQVGVANPASVYCEDQGGRSEIVNNPDGSQGGDCVFPDGSKCDEWAFFRKECVSGAK
jgi:putative hemolysin